MKTNIIFAMLLFVCLLISCNDKNEAFADLEVAPTEVSVMEQESVEVKIISGSGEYQAKSQDETKVKIFLLNNVLRIEGVAYGSTGVIVTDTKSLQTVRLNIIVLSEKTMKFVALKVIELKATKDGNNLQDIPHEKLKEYWGKRIVDNTPLELRLKQDSMCVFKPNDVVEKYKIDWRGDELFLYNQYSDSWRYCGVKTRDNGFTLNIGFYVIDSKTERRSLLLVGQDYAYKKHLEIGNYPNAGIIWTKVNVQFQ